MTENITELENTLENIVIEEVHPVVKRSVGRPRKIINENEPKKKYQYYVYFTNLHMYLWFSRYNLFNNLFNKSKYWKVCFKTH